MLLPELLPLLDGTRSVPEIVGKLGRAAEPSVTNALAALAENGLLTEGTPPLPSSAATRRKRHVRRSRDAATTPTKADSALASARVAIAGESPIAGEAARLLGTSGVGNVRRVQLDDVGGADEFVVCAPAPAETAGLMTVNASRLAAGRAWLAVMPHDGRSLVVGPLYLPGQSACHACYRLRRASASGYEEDFELVDVEPIRAACPEALAAVAAGLAATITLRWLATSDASLPGRCYALEAGVVLGLSLHHVLGCHAARRAARATVHAEPRGSRRRHVTTELRDVPFTPVDEALERLELVVSPLGGIVTHVVHAMHATDDCSLVQTSCHVAPTDRLLGSSTPEYSGGAHPLASHSRAAAIGEAVERYCATYVPQESLVLSTAAALGAAVPPERFALFHPAQTAAPGLPLRGLPRRHRFASSVLSHSSTAAPPSFPAQLVYLAPIGSDETAIAYATSNGLASGASFEEAVLRALLELVERDAVMLAWKNRLSLPLLEWDGDSELVALDDRHFRRTRLRYSVLDGSVFLGVPVADRGRSRSPRGADGARPRRRRRGDDCRGVAKGARRGIQRPPLARARDAQGPDRGPARGRGRAHVRRPHALLRASRASPAGWLPRRVGRSDAGLRDRPTRGLDARALKSRRSPRCSHEGACRRTPPT